MKLRIPDPDIRPVISLLVANGISQFGNMFSLIAIPWFVLETTGSASHTSVTVAAGVIPLVIVSIFGGSLVDRFGYKNSSVVSDVLSGVSVLLIPLLYHTVGLAFWQLLLLVALGAFMDTPGITARQALYPELVAQSNLSLDRANAAYSLTGRVAALLGPPLAGVLVAFLGASNLLWFDAATFAVSALLITLAIPSMTIHKAIAYGGVGGYLHDVASGFGFIYSNRLLFWMTISSALGSLIAEPIYSFLLPVYANEILDSAAQLGLIFAALGAGSIIGNFVYVVVESRLSRTIIYLAGYFVRALSFVVMLFEPSWWMIAIAIFIGAVTLEPINPLSLTIRQEQVPAGMRGKVFGVSSALLFVTLPVGILLYGLLISAIGLDHTLTAFVAFNLVLPLVLITIPALRNIPRADRAPLA